MSDYLNLTGPHLSALGLGGASLQAAATPPVANPPTAAPVPAAAPIHGPIAADTQLQGTLSGLLGNELDRVATTSIPLSRDVLSLQSGPAPALAKAAPTDVLSGFLAQSPPVSMQGLGLAQGAQVALSPAPEAVRGLPEGGADVLARWEAPVVDLDPAAIGKIDLSTPAVASATPLDDRVIAGDREMYQQRYNQVGDVLELGRPSNDVAAALGDVQPLALTDAPAISMASPAPPEGAPVSETKRLDRLISMMAKGVDVRQVDNPLLGSRAVVGIKGVQAISQEPYGSAGSLGMNPTLHAGGLDPAGLLSEHMRGEIT